MVQITTPDIYTIRKAITPQAPTHVRISDSLLLSDLLTAHSLYEYGYSNSIREGEWAIMLREAAKLAELLEALQVEHGPFSITYGRISPSLSEQIVRWRDPKLPSLHRYDDGAAADVIFHNFLQRLGNLGAPVMLAHEIDRVQDYHRMITYAESEGICLATRLADGHRPARKFYENRYTGFKQPQHLKWTRKDRHRSPEEVLDALNSIDWRGKGWPSYHLKGQRQYQHMRVSHYSVVLDYLYDERNVEHGAVNVLPVASIEARHARGMFERAGRVFDLVVGTWQKRISIVSGYKMGATRSAHTWQRGWKYEFIPAASIDVNDVLDLLDGSRDEFDITTLKYQKTRRKILVGGK